MLSKFKHMEKLNLCGSEIKDISFIKDLKHLTSLDLRYNKINKLEEIIAEVELEINIAHKDWSNKPGILLHGNPIEDPPIEILKMGIEAIRVYFKSLKGEKRALNEVKVLLVGDGGVGKTSLVKRLFGQTINKNEPQTHGINVNHKWEVTSEKVIKIPALM